MEYWVWCGIDNGRPDGECQALIVQARRLARNTGAQVAALAVDVSAEAALPYIYGADLIRFANTGGGAISKARTLYGMIRAYGPEIILFSANSLDAQIAAGAAALADTGLSADCTGLEMDGDLLIARRPAFGGGVIADIICRSSRPQMATVRPAAFPAANALPDSGAAIRFVPGETPEADPVRLISRELTERGTGLRNADVIVSGGLGVGGKEGFALLGRLAQALGGVVGASRAAVDVGYAPWQAQVGQTGSSVHPGLYLAFGISGAVQHIAGMHGSRYIVAVNTDHKAPIFDYADLAIVGDWRKVAQGLLKEFSK